VNSRRDGTVRLAIALVGSALAAACERGPGSNSNQAEGAITIAASGPVLDTRPEKESQSNPNLEAQNPVVTYLSEQKIYVTSWAVGRLVNSGERNCFGLQFDDPPLDGEIGILAFEKEGNLPFWDPDNSKLVFDGVSVTLGQRVQFGADVLERGSSYLEGRELSDSLTGCEGSHVVLVRVDGPINTKLDQRR